MSTAQVVITIVTSSAFTTAIVEIVRELRRYFEKKNNKGFHKLEEDISEISSKLKEIAEEQEKIRDDLDGSKETEKVLLHDRIWQAFRFFYDKHEISVDDKANIEYLYEEYRKKKGNHNAKTMYEYIKTLPVKPETKEGEV